MTRKKKLEARAWRFGVKLDMLAIYRYEVGKLGFEAGYRAAIHDARKAFHDGRHAGNAFYLAAPMVEFLKPLR